MVLGNKDEQLNKHLRKNPLASFSPFWSAAPYSTWGGGGDGMRVGVLRFSFLCCSSFLSQHVSISCSLLLLLVLLLPCLGGSCLLTCFPGLLDSDVQLLSLWLKNPNSKNSLVKAQGHKLCVNLLGGWHCWIPLPPLSSAVPGVAGQARCVTYRQQDHSSRVSQAFK